MERNQGRFGRSALLAAVVMIVAGGCLLRSSTQTVGGKQFFFGGEEAQRAESLMADDPRDKPLAERCSYWRRAAQRVDGGDLSDWLDAKSEQACEAADHEKKEAKRKKAKEEARLAKITEDIDRKAEAKEAEGKPARDKARLEAAQKAQEEARRTEEEAARAAEERFAANRSAAAKLSAAVTKNPARYLKAGQQAVLSVLTAPSTARLADEEVALVCGNGGVITTHVVDAQNGFGAMIRSTMSVAQSDGFPPFVTTEPISSGIISVFDEGEVYDLCATLGGTSREGLACWRRCASASIGCSGEECKQTARLCQDSCTASLPGPRVVDPKLVSNQIWLMNRNFATRASRGRGR